MLIKTTKDIPVRKNMAITLARIAQTEEARAQMREHDGFKILGQLGSQILA
jgi:hypothetical protein